MTILTDYRTQVLSLVGDPLVTRFTNDQVDEALRLALLEYSTVYPQLLNSIFTVSTAGKDQVMTGVQNLKNVLRVQFPYEDDDSLYFAATYFYYSQGSPALYFASQNYPQVGDQFKVYYSANHTIQNLDAAAATTLPNAHDSILVEGAAGFASQIRAAQMAESFASSTDALIAQAAYYLSNFRNNLIRLKAESPFFFPLSGFDVDKF
jgi:hypothetical protein